MKTTINTIILFFAAIQLNAENGHDLWLRNKSAEPVNIVCKNSSATLTVARQELQNSWQGKAGATVVLTVKKDIQIKGDGYKISTGGIQANTDLGILYGVYDLLRRQQTGERITDEVVNPSYERRILNHWDNLNGTIERGYAGHSIFWREGKDSLVVTKNDKKLWQEYARANASIGINGAVLDNVNASPKVLPECCVRTVSKRILLLILHHLP